jgi:hypothetical protein
MREHEGVPSKSRSPVLHNVFDIPERLKEIDPRFFVMFNHRTRKFEIHDNMQIYNTLAVVLPFEELDARTIDYVRGRMNNDVIAMARMIEEENERLEAKKQADLLDKAGYKTKQALKYLDSSLKTTDRIPQELIAE